MSLPTEAERDHPDNYSSALEWLQATGKLEQAGTVQMYKARSLFITQGMSPEVISREVGVSRYMVEHWVSSFDWHELRQKMLFKHFEKIQSLHEKRGGDMDARQDRIAHTLEGAIELMLHRHGDENDEFELAAKDLTAVAGAIKSMQSVRRTAHGKAEKAVEQRTEVTFDTGDGMNKLAGIVEGMFGARPVISGTEHAKLVIGTAQDAEFEVVEDADEESSEFHRE